MKILKISKDETYLENSNSIPIKPWKKYRVTASIISRKGMMYASFFGVIILGQHGKEIGRKWRWINENSHELKEYEIVFSTTSDAKFVVIGYRINTETPLRDDVELQVQDLNSIQINEISYDEEELFDSPYVHVPKLNPLNDEQENILEKKWFGFWDT